MKWPTICMIKQCWKVHCSTLLSAEKIYFSSLGLIVFNIRYISYLSSIYFLTNDSRNKSFSYFSWLWLWIWESYRKNVGEVSNTQTHYYLRLESLRFLPMARYTYQKNWNKPKLQSILLVPLNYIRQGSFFINVLAFWLYCFQKCPVVVIFFLCESSSSASFLRCSIKMDNQKVDNSKHSFHNMFCMTS